MKLKQFLRVLEYTLLHTAVGRRLLGAAVGSSNFSKEHVAAIVIHPMEQMEQVGDFSNTQPHASYVALTHGLSNSWTFLSRVINLAVDQLQPLENCIRHRIIPSLTGRGPPGDLERKLLTLLHRLGGMGIFNPVKTMSMNYNFSVEVTAPFVEKIISQGEDIQEILSKLECWKRRVHQMRHTLHCAEGAVTC